MDFETIKNTFLRNARQIGKIDHFAEVEVDQSVIRDYNMMEKTVKGITFVINGTERYYSFYYVENGVPYFTRAKEGIKRELLRVLYHRDFCLQLTDDISAKHDLVGKLAELFLNRNARQDIFTIIAKFYRQHRRPGVKKEYTIGYKVTRYDKVRMLFDADVVISVISYNEKGLYLETMEYNCRFIENKFNNIYQANNGLAVTMDEVFGE